MTLSVANVQPAAALQAASVGSVGAVAAAGPVNTPVSVPTGSAPVPQDGVDRVPHADVVLKDVLVHVSERLAGPLPPLRTPQAQLALAQHRDFGSPFPGLAAGLGGPGAEAAKPGSEATAGPALSRAGADAPAIGAPAGPPAPSAAPAAGHRRPRRQPRGNPPPRPSRCRNRQWRPTRPLRPRSTRTRHRPPTPRSPASNASANAGAPAIPRAKATTKPTRPTRTSPTPASATAPPDTPASRRAHSRRMSSTIRPPGSAGPQFEWPTLFITSR